MRESEEEVAKSPADGDQQRPFEPAEGDLQRLLKPLDSKNVADSNPRGKRVGDDEDNRAEEEEEEEEEKKKSEANSIYRKNKEKKAGKSDLKHRAKVMRSWPRVTIDLHALKDADYPLGLKFSVTYHDTHAYERHTGPVVLILHGLQLPAVNFSPLIEPLVDKGFRVIAPIFPLCGHNIFKANPNLVTTAKEMFLFSHSTIEKGIFIHDFARTVLGGDRMLVDVLVAENIASYPAVWLSATNFAKGVVFLDAFPAKPLPIMKPHSLFSLMSYFWESSATHPQRILSLPFMASLMLRSRFGSTSFKEASVHARNVAFADFDSVNGGLTTIAMRGIPAVVYASKRNKFVGADDARDLMRRLGVEDKFVADLDATGTDYTSSSSASSSSSSSYSSPPSPLHLSPTTTSHSSNEKSASQTEELAAYSKARPSDTVNDSIIGNNNIVGRTLYPDQRPQQPRSVGRIFEPRKQDSFGAYNRRYAKGDWYHLAQPIANDIERMVQGFQTKR